MIRVAAAVVFALGALVLVGWALRVPPLVQVIPGAAPMQPNTALGFCLAGSALWRGRGVEVLGAAALGILALLDYASVDTGTATLLFEPWTTTATYRPGLMSPATAGSFVLSAGLLAGRRVRAVAGVLVAVAGGTTLLGYVSGTSASYSWGPWTDMAVHTSGAFVLVGGGMVVSANLGERAASLAMAGGLGATGLALAVATGSPVIVGFSLAFAAAMALTNARTRRVIQAESKLKAEREHREAVNSRMALFVGETCHDLRSPLNHVVHLARMASNPTSGVTAADVAEAAEHIHRQVVAIERIYGSLTGKRELVTLAALMDDVLVSKRNHIEKHGASVHVTGADVRMPMAARTILLNLVANAAKYGGTAPRITVTASESVGSVRVTVRDHGRGFEPEQSERLFDAGFRAHDSTPGHGLGLSFCRQVTDELGGRIWAESDGPGRGAAFTFELPLEDS